jgi:hypothetical protein
MNEIFVLNESNEPSVIGDIQIYWSLEKLLDYIEAIDVVAGILHVYSTRGYRIQLFADHEYAPVTTRIQSPSNDDRKVVEGLLRQYLTFLENDGRFGLQKGMLTNSTTLTELMELVPKSTVQ